MCSLDQSRMALIDPLLTNALVRNYDDKKSFEYSE